MNAQAVEVSLLGGDISPEALALVEPAAPDLRMLSHTGTGKESTTYSPRHSRSLKKVARMPKRASQREAGMARSLLLRRLLLIMFGMYPCSWRKWRLRSMLEPKKADATRATVITSALERRACGSSRCPAAFRNSSHRQ